MNKLLEKQEQAIPKQAEERNNKNKGWNQWNKKKPYKESMKKKAGSLKE
jgi:hypothetical protein